REIAETLCPGEHGGRARDDDVATPGQRLAAERLPRDASHDERRAHREPFHAPHVAPVMPRDLAVDADDALGRDGGHDAALPPHHTATLNEIGGCGSYPSSTKWRITSSVLASSRGLMSSSERMPGAIDRRGSGRGFR